MGSRIPDLCSQSRISADVGARRGGSEGWDGMLKCLNCGQGDASGGGKEVEGVKVIRLKSIPKPIYLGLMDLKATGTS